jgi:hypothetical protein
MPILSNATAVQSRLVKSCARDHGLQSSRTKVKRRVERREVEQRETANDKAYRVLPRLSRLA